MILTVFVPVRDAAFEKARRSEALLETSSHSAAVLSEMPELPSVIVRVVLSAKFSVELVALRLLMFVDNAPEPLKSSVPPPVMDTPPEFVFEPLSVRLPEPVLVSEPVPLMMPEMDWLLVEAKTSAPLLEILPE